MPDPYTSFAGIGTSAPFSTPALPAKGQVPDALLPDVPLPDSGQRLPVDGQRLSDSRFAMYERIEEN